MRTTLSQVEGLQYPERIQSTELSMYCATVSQIADLTDGDLRWFAEHLEHNLDVHKDCRVDKSLQIIVSDG